MRLKCALYCVMQIKNEKLHLKGEKMRCAERCCAASVDIGVRVANIVCGNGNAVSKRRQARITL